MAFGDEHLRNNLWPLERRISGLGAQLGYGHELQQGAIDDWRTRFRDDYFTQMMNGVTQAQGDMMASAGVYGANPALMRGAGRAGGEMMANAVMGSESIGRNMNLADQYAQYAASQNVAGDKLATHDLVNQTQNAYRGIFEARDEIARRHQQDQQEELDESGWV